MIIKIDKDIGIKTINKFYLCLREKLQDNDTVVLDFAEVRRIDLSVAQLLISLRRELLIKEKSLKLESVSENVAKLLDLAGYSG